ncbi:unnamed protein product [Fraxinus pennsylvanica]|uniref:Uncharacterized protein n=1 Tax=Fraxinus pennsylvanica TaxID=56036 RepID=A0AAD1ZQ11_9LAMI|nr:unnamed protein product [Fraxinus pennsylvanica]
MDRSIDDILRRRSISHGPVVDLWIDDILCEIDIFMEASKLAAEYLVTKAILPPNALSGKWQNGDWKNQMEDFMQIHMDSRTAVHSRLGTAAVDVGPGRRRYSDEYNLMGSKNSIRGMRTGSSKNHGSDWNLEFVRSAS